MKSLTNVVLKNAKRSEKKSIDILAVLSFIIVFVFLAVIMTVVSYKITKELIEMNQPYTFISILLLMNFGILFTKSIFESLNVLYFSKDLKFLLRMPLKSKDILHAKLINMIISEYQMEIIMLAIPMIVYGVCTKVNFLFYMYMVVILLVIPIIPISITSLILSIIMRFTNKIKNKSKAMYITMIIAVFLLGLISINSNMNYTDLIKPIINTLINYNNIDGLKNVILYVFENILCYIITLEIMSKIYLKGAIGCTINGKKDLKKEKSKLELNDFKQKGTKRAYINKELKVLSRTPIFNIQCLIMPIVYPIVIIAIVVFSIEFAERRGIDVLSQLYRILNNVTGQAIILAIGQVFYMLNFNSIIAISKDSRSAKLIKYIPININEQYNLKIFIGVVINMISSILLTIFYYIYTHNTVATIIIFIGLVVLNLIGERIKLLIDERNPQINWDSEYTMMKKNTNVMYELFYTLAIVGILIIVGNLINTVA